MAFNDTRNPPSSSLKLPPQQNEIPVSQNSGVILTANRHRQRTRGSSGHSPRIFATKRKSQLYDGTISTWPTPGGVVPFSRPHTPSRQRHGGVLYLARKDHTLTESPAN